MGLLDLLPWRKKAVDVSTAYVALVKQARTPTLYGDTKAPDTVDGRFDILAVHVHIVLRRLRQEGLARDEIGQSLFDLFFADMDQAMRESGVGDLGVGKRIRKMAQAFYGRAAAYDEAMGKAAPAEAGCVGALTGVLTRNLDPNGARDNAETGQGMAELAQYLVSLEAHLAQQSVDDILAGKGFVSF